MIENLIRVESVVDPGAKRVTVEKLAKRYYLVSGPKQLSPTDALLEVARVDPDGEKRRGE